MAIAIPPILAVSRSAMSTPAIRVWLACLLLGWATSSMAEVAVPPLAQRVCEDWKLGRRTVRDGVLLVVATDDRRLHVEVGDELAGAIPEAVFKRVLKEDVTPRFYAGDTFGAVVVGVERLSGVIANAERVREKSMSEGVPSNTRTI